MTPLEKLKALAAAKKAAQSEEKKDEVPSSNTVGNTVNCSNDPGSVAVSEHSTNGGVTNNETATVEHMVHSTFEEPTQELQHSEPEVPSNEGQPSCGENSGSAEASSGDGGNAGGDDHPLVMQLAELEQALNENLPEFRTILRDIHSKLRQDPAIVTALSEDEIGAIVSGLIHHANIEIVAPKAVKSAKKAAKAPVSASDL